MDLFNNSDDFDFSTSMDNKFGVFSLETSFDEFSSTWPEMEDEFPALPFNLEEESGVAYVDSVQYAIDL